MLIIDLDVLKKMCIMIWKYLGYSFLWTIVSVIQKMTVLNLFTNVWNHVSVFISEYLKNFNDNLHILLKHWQALASTRTILVSSHCYRQIYGIRPNKIKIWSWKQWNNSRLPRYAKKQLFPLLLIINSARVTISTLLNNMIKSKNLELRT